MIEVPATWTVRRGGTIVQENETASRLLGPASSVNTNCAETMLALPDSEDLPCYPACTEDLFTKGIEGAKKTRVRIGGEPHDLTCIPVDARECIICVATRSALISPEKWQIPTRRELDVLRLVADDLTAPDIAEELCISKATVQTHLEKLRNKFSARTRAALVTKGFRFGFLD